MSDARGDHAVPETAPSDAPEAAPEAARAAEAAPAAGFRRTPRWIVWTLAVFFGLFYAYSVWQGIGNLLQFPKLAAALGGAVSVQGWVIMIVAVIVPVLCFAAAFAIGRRRGVIAIVLTYLAGLGASAAFTQSLIILS